MPVILLPVKKDNQAGDLSHPQYCIKLHGYFEFADYYEWKSVLEDMDEATNYLEIDCGGIDYMDSSALGLLLLLNQKFSQPPIIEFTHVNRSVCKLLERSGMMAVLATARFVKQAG